MNSLEIVRNEEFGNVRIWRDGDRILFCGVDVAAALGYKDTVNALKSHCLEDGVAFYHLIDSMGRKQKAKFITEGNVYRLIVHSKLPSAVKFERWLFDDVLPCIRKHGMYVTDETLAMAGKNPELIQVLTEDIIAEREKNRQLENAVSQLLPKAAFFDAFIHPENCTTLRVTAKELQVPERRFCRFLIEGGFLYRTPSGDLLPYATPRNEGLFRVKDYCCHGHAGSYTLITPKGKELFRLLVRESDMPNA